jgi:hypothetical protein
MSAIRKHDATHCAHSNEEGNSASVRATDRLVNILSSRAARAGGNELAEMTGDSRPILKKSAHKG